MLTLEDLAEKLKLRTACQEQLTERPDGLSVYASSERGRGGLQIGKRRESYSVAWPPPEPNSEKPL